MDLFKAPDGRITKKQTVGRTDVKADAKREGGMDRREGGREGGMSRQQIYRSILMQIHR